MGREEVLYALEELKKQCDCSKSFINIAIAAQAYLNELEAFWESFKNNEAG
uniref:Uncharacterized protein n=1 Tax=viral metagenome TaxID=1070528 RepID=A0A6M3K9S7_9ZZZZ